MEKEIQILYGAINSFNSEHGRAKQIYSRLAKNSRVNIIWVDPPHFHRNIISNFKNIINPINRHQIKIFDNIQAFISIGLPRHMQSKLMWKLTEKMLMIFFENLKLSYNLLIISNPIFTKYSYLIKKSGIPIIYDCRDYFPVWSHVRKHAIKMEKQLLSISDWVIVPSNSLKSELLKINPNCKISVIPNGVPKSMIENKKNKRVSSSPSIGFIGDMGSYVNLKLIIEIARKKPEWNFIFVGETTRIEPIVNDAPNNCDFLGEVPFDHLDSILQRLDVGIIPFKKSKGVDVAFPIKLVEYFAKGIPVVSTPMKELQNLDDSHLIYFADCEVEWIEQIENALKDNRQKEFIEFAKKYTWENATDCYLQCLKNLLS